jgi:hypothetical protein
LTFAGARRKIIPSIIILRGCDKRLFFFDLVQRDCSA